MTCLRYTDKVRVIKTSANGYGDESIESEATVPALFFQGTGQTHSSNVDYITTSTHVYLDHNNEFIKSNQYRLEGMRVVYNPFGIAGDENWYKIVSVEIGITKLTCNKIDNVHCYLEKVNKL